MALIHEKGPPQGWAALSKVSGGISVRPVDPLGRFTPSWAALTGDLPSCSKTSLQYLSRHQITSFAFVELTRIVAQVSGFEKHFLQLFCKCALPCVNGAYGPDKRGFCTFQAGFFTVQTEHHGCVRPVLQGFCSFGAERTFWCSDCRQRPVTLGAR